jgi:hypothetical protein
MIEKKIILIDLNSINSSTTKKNKRTKPIGMVNLPYLITTKNDSSA